MVVIQVADYAQFKGVVAMLGKGKPVPHIMVVEETTPPSFTVVALVDSAVVSILHKFDVKPATFDLDFPHAVLIAGIGIGA